MTRNILFVLAVIVGVVSVSYGQLAYDDSGLRSVFDGRTFYKTAYETYTLPRAGDAEAGESLVLLRSALTLDAKAYYAMDDILNLGPILAGADYVDQMRYAIGEYASESIDLEATRKAVAYLLGALDSREKRVQELEGLLMLVGDKSAMLSSELLMQLAMLQMEVADDKKAQEYLGQAYDANPYNMQAFVELQRSLKKSGLSMSAADYALHLRRVMVLNPYDLGGVLDFAGFAESEGLYGLACDAYGYGAKLFEVQMADKKLPASIYLPWTIAAFNSAEDVESCIAIASRVRDGGKFDLFAEAMAGAAYRKMGAIEKSKTLLVHAAIKAESIARGGGDGEEAISAMNMAWFYSFAMPDADKALVWANRAYGKEPEGGDVRAMLAYAMVSQKQDAEQEQLMQESAKEILGGDDLKLYENNQIASLVMAVIAGTENDSGVIEMLVRGIEMDSSSLAAEAGRELIKRAGGEYVSKANSAIVSKLNTEFGQKIIPDFAMPDQKLSFKLDADAREYSFGRDFKAKLVIDNRSADPIFFASDSILKGGIRIDAKVSGDIETSIPFLVEKKVRPSLAIMPGESISIPVEVYTSRLADVLNSHPQATVEIEFKAYLDPVAGDEGQTLCGIGVKPARLKVRRAGAVLTRVTLMQKLDDMSQGTVKQKIRAGQLFVALLNEQHTGKKPAYRFTGITKAVLVELITTGLANSDWTVKLQTMGALLEMDGKLDFGLIDAISQNLNDRRWPVRMMAILLLDKLQGKDFLPVLEWKAENDPHAGVKQMAASIAANYRK